MKTLEVKSIIICMLLLLIVQAGLRAQNCLGGADIIQGKVGTHFLKSMSTNRLIVGGTYNTSYSPNNIMGGDTVTARAGDLLTIYAAVLDSNLNLVRMFNVIGFNDLGGSFNQTRVYDMHADAAGNIYFCGAFAQDTLVSYFGDTVYSDGYQEAFIIRCDTMGNTTLLKSCGTRQWNTNYNFEDKAFAITSDVNGNIDFTVSGDGYYLTINADTVNSTSTWNTVDYSDIYVISLFPNGNTRWLKNFGTPGKDDVAYDIAVNAQGELALTGAVNGSNSVFHFGALTHSYVYSQYGIQGFIGKLDSMGVAIWLSPIEVHYPSGPDIGAYCAAIDDSGYVYGSGYFDAWAVFNGDTIQSSYYSSNYFSKYDLTGQTMFVKLGNIDTFYPYPIFMEVKNGKAFITGQCYTNQLIFGPFGQCCSMKSYAVMYNTQGQVLWLRGAKNSSSGTDMDLQMGTINENGTAYVSGITSGGEIVPLTINANAGIGFVLKFGEVANSNVSLSIANTGNDTITCGYSTYLQRTISPSGATLTWWADNDTIPNPNTTTNFNATPKFNTLYVATAFYNGCSVSDSIMVYVTALPVNAGADTVICNGSTFALEGNTIFGASYLWEPSSAVDSSNLANTNFIANQSTQLTYTVSRAGCSNSDTVDITVQQSPQASFNANYNLSSLAVDFENNALNFDSLIWNFGDGNTDTAINPTHTYAQNGFYSACLYVYNACGIDTLCQDIDLTIVGLQDYIVKERVTQTESGFEILGNEIINHFVLFDITGKLLEQKQTNQKQIEINLNAKPHGCYLLKLNTAKGNKVLRLIW
ncbi:MAG TPA: PKD domain-containing protein [Bacteroidia bacterium]|nr:PKD domain-containing protein [Bacteroidia bacterium]